MTLNRITIAQLIGSIGVAVAIGAAPVAAAANPPSCVDLGGSTQCQTPGNVQIHNSPAVLQNSGTFPQFGSTYGPFFNYDRA